MADCGCPPNTSSLIQGPQGEPGVDGANATCNDGTNALVRLDTSFGLGAVTALNTWTTIGYIIYPGTINLSQAITSILTIANTTSSGQLRLIGSLGTIATSSIFTNGSAAIIDLGVINSSNLNSTVEVLQLQALANGGSTTAFALSLLSI